MDVTRHEFEDLVGAYALDACEPDEAAALDVYIGEHADVAAEAERLRNVAAWLGAAGALEPPSPLRERLLAAVSARVDPLPPGETLRRESDRFDHFLDSLAPDDLDVVTHNGLTVRDLVAHVAIMDEAFVQAADNPASVFIGAAEVEQITRRALPAIAGLSFDQVRDRWRHAREALAGLEARLPAGTRIAGYSLESVLVIRAFETWTHLDDIARALGRPVEPTDPRALRSMADLAVRTLPIALAAKGYDFSDRTARVVLTGVGGGEWTIACGVGREPARVPHVVLRAPVVELCRRFADRLAADEVPLEIEGEDDLARALVACAPAFAGL